MENLSKKTLQQLKKLTAKAHKNELDFHTGELAKKFEEWKNNEINCWDLNDCIHKFHDGISREIYKTYNYGINEVFLVARAIVHNFLQKEEIPEEAETIINNIVNRIKLKE